MVMMGPRPRRGDIADIIPITSREYYVNNISHGCSAGRLYDSPELPTYLLDLSVLPHHERE
jgi:hypothetical protein